MYFGNPVTYIADCNIERVSGVILTLGIHSNNTATEPDPKICSISRVDIVELCS